jgi:carbamate kinase
MQPGERGTAAQQRANLAATFRAAAPLFADGPFVVTHGNGPQVGNELLRQERAAEEAPPLPLYLAVAQTQAEIGALVESELAPVAGRAVACLLTHVLVAEDDPAFGEPTKPVGPFYDEARARALEAERGWHVVHDANRGWRRVVPSPAPLQVVELDAIRALLASGTIVVACGGGGIPATRRGEHLAGIDAVIDKDRASSLLARELGADRLVILTEVPAVYSGFGTPGQRELRELSAAEAEALVPELAAGSMRPKVEASVEFVRATGRAALITSPSALGEAIEGRAGTLIR